MKLAIFSLKGPQNIFDSLKDTKNYFSSMVQPCTMPEKSIQVSGD